MNEQDVWTRQSSWWEPDDDGIVRKKTESSYSDSRSGLVLNSRYSYDAYGNITAVTDANGIITSYSYSNDHSRLTGEFTNTNGGIICVDDFNDEDISDGDPISWTTSGGWSFSNGIMKSSYSAYAGNHNAALANFVVDVKLRIRYDYGDPTRWAGVHFGSTSSNVFDTGALIYYRYNGDIDMYQQGKRIKGVPTHLSPTVWRRLSIHVNGSSVQVFVDGKRMFVGTFPVQLSPGYVGLCTFATDTEFDDFRCYPLGASPRTFGFDPLTLQLTDVSDPENISRRFTYDALQRLSTVYDYEGNLLDRYSYYYSRPGNNDTYSSSAPNYIGSIHYRSSSDYSDERNYYDGLGRKLQSQSKNGSAAIVSGTMIYDESGRLSKVYKPYELASHSSLSFDASYSTNVSNYWSQYGHGSPYYSETVYCADPLDRVKEQGFAGAAWKVGSNHDKRFTYSAYSNDLYKQSAKDEQGLVTDTYKDQFERIRKSVQDPGSSPSLNLETDYYYDMVDNVTKTLDPSDKQTIFTHNTLKQLSEKTSPDAGTVQYLYDRNGNLRFMKDANHAGTSWEFIYYKYDALNRLVEIGEAPAHSPSYFTQANADDWDMIIPSSMYQKLFGFDIAFQSDQRNTKGRLSYAASYKGLTKQLETYYSYDNEGRVEWIRHGYLGRQTPIQINYSYDRQGNVTRKYLKDPADIGNTLYTFYTYDQPGRLATVATAQSGDGAGMALNGRYTYLASGKPLRLQLGNAQGVDYRYNERDWLTNINSKNSNLADDPGGDGSNGIAVDRFQEVLGYNNIQLIGADQGNSPIYNGNISWMAYKMADVDYASETGVVGWAYSYDRANRLKSSAFGFAYPSGGWESGYSYGLSPMSYDKSGNISRLYRVDADDNREDLRYTYLPSTNKVTSIWDTYSNRTYMYQYDANGNTKYDSHGGITSVAYNLQNLPEQVVKSGLRVYYTYDANGNRIRKQATDSTDELYIIGKDGETEAVFETSGMLKFWNILAGTESIGRIEKK